MPQYQRVVVMFSSKSTIGPMISMNYSHCHRKRVTTEHCWMTLVACNAWSIILIETIMTTMTAAAKSMMFAKIAKNRFGKCIILLNTVSDGMTD